MAKIGAPLFILREECQKDLFGVLEKLGALGFDGVEFLGLFGHNPGAIRKKLEVCGLEAIGDHVPYDEFRRNTDGIIERYKALGCKYVTIGAPPADAMPGGPGYGETIECITRIGEAVRRAGMALLYHNHAEEARTLVGGKPVLEHIADDFAPSALSLEPDLGWIRIGGGDPMQYLEKYPDRCPVVHFKDFVFDAAGSHIFRPTGYGVMDFASLYAKTLSFAAPPCWYVMDHDCAYERDIYEDLAISLEYFKNLIRVTG